MSRILFISPMVPTTDLSASAGFLVGALGFKEVFNEDGYGICERDGLTIHFLPAGSDVGQMETYIEVDDVDDVWEGMKDKVGDIKHKEPFDRPYGMREIHVELPATKCLLFIGQSIT